MQYSDALNIIPASKLPVGPEIGFDEPTLKGDEGESTTDADKEPTTDADKESTTDEDNEPEATTDEDNEAASTVPPNRVLPTDKLGTDLASNLSPNVSAGFGGRLAGENLTQLTSPKYTMKISFSSIMPNTISGSKNCAEWNLAAYVQGKLVHIRDVQNLADVFGGDPSGERIGVCKSKSFDLESWVVDVIIPNDAVEGPQDYQPLSLFTVGYQIDDSTCPRLMNAPKELPEVIRILRDHDSTRHYYADAKENIARIQHEVQNQISLDCPPTPKTQDLMNKNQKLDTVNILEVAPNYGATETSTIVESIKSGHFYSCSEIFCLSNGISVVQN